MITTSPSLVTHGVKVSVQSMFMPEQSSAKEKTYCYAYRISITNETDSPVQLLRRHWRVLNGHGEEKIVEGDGVIGKQPVLWPGEEHGYVSGSVITTPIGTMSGFYVMVEAETGREFQVTIPTFLLVAPHTLN